VAGRIARNIDGTVATVTLDHPTKLNVMSLAMWSELRATFEVVSAMAEMRCVVVQGAGARAFSAGADIAEFETTRSTKAQVIEYHESYVGPALSAIFDCPIPVIAKIRGVCMGGGLEIASACDLRLADDTGRFGAPVGKLGFPLAFGETQAIFNLVGFTVSAELLIEGRIFDAREAFERRLITRFFSPEDLDRETMETVRNVCLGGRNAAASHKRQLRRLLGDPSSVSIEERMAVYEFAESEEYQAGFRRFLGKNKVPAP
jgi:enoyl-CoA hydratase/carnithine racemase